MTIRLAAGPIRLAEYPGRLFCRETGLPGVRAMGNTLARIMFIAGLLLIIAAILTAKGISIPFGRLPGDIIIRRENISLYLPLTTCIIISAVFSLIMLLWRR